LDGQWRHPIRVYGDFLGLVVPEGRHRVEFEFRPWSLWIGSWVSLAALGLTLALFGGSFRGLKRRAQDPDRHSGLGVPGIDGGLEFRGQTS
ncbi:MAG: hypothetical protein WB773_05955, partial [Isosphaeraceae bacterium]